MFPEIEKVPSKEGYRDQMAGLVMERKDHSETHFASVRALLPQLYNLYRGSVLGRTSPHKNNIHIPLIFSTIQSDVARKTQTSFGSWPIVGFVGNSSEDAIIARKREALVSAQMKDCGSFKKGYDLFLTADLYGTGIIQYGWKHEESDMLISHADTLPVTGEKVQIAEKRRVCTFDGPDWKVLDPLDCYPQPGVRDVENMDWFIVRDYLDLDQIRQLAKPDQNGRVIFDPAEVRRMEVEGHGAQIKGDDYKQYRAISRNLMDQDARLREKFARPVEILTMWGVIPSELAPSDGIVRRVITIANERYVLRNKPMPFWSGKIPIRAYQPMPDPHFFYGAGKAEIAYRMQIVANRFTNQQLDAMDLFIDPVFVADTAGGIDTENMFMRPGKWIEVDGPPQERLQALIPNLQGIQIGGQMTESLWRWMQQGLGIVEDTVMGGQGQRQTAREFLGRSEAVATRLTLESRMFEEDLLEPLANDFVDLNRQFLPLPKEVFILGNAATVDPVTKLPVPSRTRQSIDGWDLVPNYDARAVGATTRMGKGNRQQALTFLLQALSQAPAAQAAVNWVTFLRDIFRSFDLDNVDEILNSPAEAEKQMILLNKGARPPEEVPGTPNGNGTLGFEGLPNYPGQGVM